MNENMSIVEKIKRRLTVTIITFTTIIIPKKPISKQEFTENLSFFISFLTHSMKATKKEP